MVILCSLMFVGATYGQTFESEGKLRNTVKLPTAVLALLKKTEEVKHCSEEAEFSPGWFRAIKINVNDDGKPDYLVKSELSCLYGPRAATWWIYSQGPKGFSLVFNDTVLSLTIGGRKTNGYRDIQTDTTMVNIIRNTWKYNGHVYKLKSTKEIEPGK